MRRKSHSPLFPPFTMCLLVAEKASGKETVWIGWLHKVLQQRSQSSGWNRAIDVE